MPNTKKAAYTQPRFWKIMPGENGWHWDECWEGGFIAIGWSHLGDLSEVSPAEFRERRHASGEDMPARERDRMKEVWKFSRIRVGDYVLALRGQTGLLALGKVLGPYRFHPEERYGHRIPVAWTDLKLISPGPDLWNRNPILIKLSRTEFEEWTQSQTLPEETEDWQATRSAPTPEPCVTGIPSKALTHPDPDVDAITWERWLGSLERKGQAILYGPPGTGKTYLAEKLAQRITAGGGGFYELLQLHSSYAYEDFVQGIRPTTGEDGRLTYPMVPGRFLQFCRRAENAPGRCVLILDEINRADLSRTFGELMYLLEYRNRKICLAGDGHFGIPSNVRIIGTMNTADRNIAWLDHALRRRFAFLPLQPDYQVLRRFLERRNFPAQGLLEVLRRINLRIENPHFHMGISYFMREGLMDCLEPIWLTEIEPYLEEYFFDQPGAVSEFRWDKVKETFSKPSTAGPTSGQVE